MLGKKLLVLPNRRGTQALQVGPNLSLISACWRGLNYEELRDDDKRAEK